MNEENVEKIQAVENLIGSSWWTVIQALYLMGKYQDSCIFLPFSIEPLTDERYAQFTEKPLSNFVAISWICQGDSCSLEPPQALESFDSYTTLLRECVQNSERFAVIPLELIAERTGHANMLIYDKIAHTLERFDSNGFTGERYQPKLLDDALLEHFTYILDDEKLEYAPPEDFCPLKGPQILEAITREKFGIPIKTGFCSVWSFVYANFRLKYPEYKKETIVHLLTETIPKKQSNLWDFIVEIVLMLAELSNKIKNANTVEEIERAILEVVSEYNLNVSF